ncbi:MAG: sulfur carrier protein ThiS [Thermodesulfobacteriota bacterium]
MNIQLNGKRFLLSDGSTIEALLKGLEITHRGIAVELNREIIPKSRYTDTYLKEGDRLEIVQMVGGG